MHILNSRPTCFTFKLGKELQICKIGNAGMHVYTYILFPSIIRFTTRPRQDFPLNISTKTQF